MSLKCKLKNLQDYLGNKVIFVQVETMDYYLQ